ncbi:MAG: hypothetical protein DHS20C14_04650 [Phycisphaeraceae bacterium]|nr:MAG: hypothetical protein DHS20C14_04650 [Phycisphaeraceae bacterium]
MQRASSRAARALVVLGLVGASLLAASGCRSTAPKRTTGPAYTTDVAAPSIDLGGLDGGNQGGASDVVFSNPTVQSYYIAIKPEVLEELRRRDRELAIYDPAPLTALESEWPTAARPSLDEQRLIRTRTASDRTFIYYGVDDRR